MMALLVGVLAQTCVSMLPAPDATREWFRDGRPFARDVSVSATQTSRSYRRELANGRSTERIMSCGSSAGASWLVDEVAGSVTVRLPISLRVGASVTAAGATIRRIDPPADAGRGARGSAWFTGRNPGVTVYGVAPGTGIVEVRSPSAAGGFSVLRAVRRDPAPTDTAVTAAAADQEAQRRVLLERIGYLEITQMTLRDSIARLSARLDSARAVPYSPATVVVFSAVDVYVERGEYDAALELLAAVNRRLRAWSDSAGTRHRALDSVDTRLHDVLVACAAAAARRSPHDRPLSCSTGDHAW
jgi:hypothetical protein